MAVPLVMPSQDLQKRIVPKRIPDQEQYRRYYGRTLDVRRVEAAIQDANYGLMVDLCDLESESLGMDPHLLSVCGKRFGNLQAVDWAIEPAKGPDVDKKLAAEIADITRNQLLRVPDFEDRLYDLAWSLFDGRGAMEVHWDYTTGGGEPWRLRSLEWIHPRRLSFGPERELLLIDTSRPSGNFIQHGLPLRDFPGKFVWWKPRLFREYPEREGLGPRTLYWALFKRLSWRNRVILTELFALPWRIIEVDPDALNVSDDALEDAFNEAQALGQESVARMGKGIHMRVEWPQGLGDANGNLLALNSDGVDLQMSKLVLGNTATTDGNEANRSNSVTQRGEQDIILHRDGAGLASRITHQVCVPIATLNRGKGAASHAARFVLKTDPPRDQISDMDLLERAVRLQVPVAVQQIRDVTGARQPEPDEAFLISAGPAQVDPMTGATTGGGVQVVDPTGSDVDPGEVQDEAADGGQLEEGGVDGQADAAEDDQPSALAAQQEAIDILLDWGVPDTELASALQAVRNADVVALTDLGLSSYRANVAIRAYADVARARTKR